MARSEKPSRRPYVMAMVLGTALSALGNVPARAEVALTERAIADISRYCTTCWRNARLPPDSWTDCTQEVFSRLLERVRLDAWNGLLRDEGEEKREFLRVVDAVKKRTQRGRKWLDSSVEVADRHDPRERRLAEEREVVRNAATELLTARQQKILQLSFEGWSVQDIAAQLRTPPERVSDEKYKAVRKLREHLKEAGET